MREKLIKFGAVVDRLVNYICIVLMAVMTCIVLLQVSSRFMPYKNPNWTEELSRYVMIYIAYIGASTGIREWTNVGVDFVIERLPKTGKFILNCIIRLTICIFWCFVLYLSVKVLPKTGLRQKSASMGFPVFYAQISLIIGAVLCIVQSLIQVITYAMGGAENA